MARSSLPARSANASMPIDVNSSCATLSSARASSRRPSRRSHSPYSRCVRASSARTRVRPRWSIAVRNQRSASAPSPSRARARASMPSAQSVRVACALVASRFSASVARSVLPHRVAGSTSSLRPQFSATTSRCSLAETAAARASSYRPRPLQRTARAYALMASPIPSPRAPASRSVVSIRSRRLARPASPRREDQRAVRRGADPRRLLDRRGLGDRRGGGGEVAAEHQHGRARAEGERELAERPRLAGDLDAGVRQRGRMLVIPDLEGDDAALPQPAQPFLGRRRLAGEPLHRLPAERDGRGVVVGEGDQRVQQQVGGGRLGVRWARRGAGGLRDLGHPDAAVEPGRRTAPRRTRPRTSRARAAMSSGSSRRAAASRSGVASVPRLETNASWARSRSIRARWSSSSGPASAVASRPRAVVNAPAWTLA